MCLNLRWLINVFLFLGIPLVCNIPTVSYSFPYNHNQVHFLMPCNLFAAAFVGFTC